MSELEQVRRERDEAEIMLRHLYDSLPWNIRHHWGGDYKEFKEGVLYEVREALGGGIGMSEYQESDWPLMTCPDCETTVDWSGIDPEDVQMEMDCPECGVHWEAELIFRVQIQHPMQIIDARSGRAAGGAADPHPTIGPAYMHGQ